jgi:hypothetical protein
VNVDLDKLGIDTILTEGKLEPFISGGLTVEDFQGPMKDVASLIWDYWANPKFKGKLPTEGIIRRKHASYTLEHHKEQHEWVIEELRKRTRYNRVSAIMASMGAAMKENNVDEASRLLYTGGLEVAGLLANTRVTNLTRNMAERKFRYEQRRDKINLYGIPSGFDWLDKWTLGWQPSDLVYLLGKRGTGKTWMLLIMAHASQVAGNPTMVVSPEMDALALERRYDALHARLPYQAFRRGELGFQLEKHYYVVLKEMEGMAPFYLPKFDGPCTPMTIQALARQLGVRWVGIDGVYMLDDDEGESQWQKHFNVARGLKKGICGTDRMICVINNQLNREDDPRTATLDNAAYSDAYSQFADIAMKLVQGSDERMNKEMLTQLMKMREEDLPTYPVRVKWDLEEMAFESLEDGAGGYVSGVNPEEMKY